MSEAQNAWVSRVLGIPPARFAAGPPDATPLNALQVWLDAKEAAGAGIGQLQGAMRALDHPVFARLADQGLNGITGRLQVGLQAALMDAEGAPGDARAKARQKARTMGAEFRSFLGTDPVLPLLDANPLGIKVALRDGLGRAMDRIDAALST